MIGNRTTESRTEYTDDIERTVVAFANTDGGKIYIGISGVENMVATMRRITTMLRDSIRPDISAFAECTVETVDGKPAVVLSVQRGIARPYYLAAKGIRPEGVYLRQGGTSYPASEAAILGMIKDTSGGRYEDARSLTQQLTFGKTEQYFARNELPFGEEEKLRLGVIGADGTYTNLGMLLSDQCPHTIRLAVFEGSKRSVFRDRKELEGPLLQQLEDAFSYINRSNRTAARTEGLARVDKQAYPADALREALLNAIAHRDYSFSGSTLINIFEDRIEIVSLGGLADGLTYHDVMLGVSSPRNPRFADILYRLKLIEAYGTGILKIGESYADCAAKPRFEVTDNAFKVTLPNRNAVRAAAPPPELHRPKAAPTSPAPARAAGAIPPPKAADKGDRRDALLHLAQKQGYLLRKDVESALKVSQPTAILILRDMVEKGLLIKEGTGKQQKYHVPER